MSIGFKERRHLKLGKLSLEELRHLVFPHLPLKAEPGLDGGFLTLRGEAAVAHAPSIGVPLETLGFFAFHYAASNVAALFARPRYLVIGIYLPPESPEEHLRIIAEGLGTEARRYGVSVVGGHTATYRGLELPMVTVTCIGERIRTPEKAEVGDLITVVGRVGGESLWLKALTQGRREWRWRRLKPLPALLRLQGVEGVRLLHDVSEGGVKGALLEIAEALGLRLDVDSRRFPYEEGIEKLGVDPLKAPSYGVLIAILNPEAAEEASEACREANYPLNIVGEVGMGLGAYVDGVKVERLERTEIDSLYGSFQGERGSGTRERG
jgi:hydrogenase maturation factor